MLAAFLLAMGMLYIYGKINLINTSCSRDHNPHVKDRNPVLETCTLSEGLVLFKFNEYSLT